MYTYHMNEIPKRPEKLNIEEEIIKKAKELGPSDPEVKKLIIEWTVTQERLVESKNDKIGGIKFEINRANLYYKIGLFDDAYESTCAAMDQAEEMGSEELFNKAQDLAEKISKA